MSANSTPNAATAAGGALPPPPYDDSSIGSTLHEQFKESLNPFGLEMYWIITIPYMLLAILVDFVKPSSPLCAQTIFKVTLGNSGCLLEDTIVHIAKVTSVNELIDPPTGKDKLLMPINRFVFE